MLAVQSIYDTFYRIKEMNYKFPMQNQSTEENSIVVRETDEEMVKVARKKHNSGYYLGCMVGNMKPYILSDLCITQRKGSLPYVKECNHTDQMR